MPYIGEADRLHLDLGEHATSPGALNYLITRLVSRYVHDVGLDYDAINDVIGVLECAKAEFYRRVAAPYEDKKREANGDVYPEESTRS